MAVRRDLLAARRELLKAKAVVVDLHLKVFAVFSDVSTLLKGRLDTD